MNEKEYKTSIKILVKDDVFVYLLQKKLDEQTTISQIIDKAVRSLMA